MTPLDPLAVPLAGAALVEASAGTGKTHTIATHYLRLVVEAGLRVDQILVVTFTNAATAELRDRLRRRLREALAVAAQEADVATTDAAPPFLRDAADRQQTVNRLRAAIHGFDEAAIFTIHGFCQRVLREYAFESGAAFDAELITDQSDILREAVCDFWVRRLHDAEPVVVDHLRAGRLGLDRIRSLAARALEHPKLQVVPAEVPPGAALAPLLEAEAAARARAAGLWAHEREAILERLTGEALNQNTHRRHKIRDAWAAKITATFAVDRPGAVQRCKELEKLTSTAIIGATKKNETPPEHRFFAACEDLVGAEAALKLSLDSGIHSLQREAMQTIPEDVRARKRQAQVLSFGDLLQDLASALSGPNGDALVAAVRQRFAAALIDEFQDTDPLQYEIFRRLFITTQAPVVFVGDPKQAIYSFRGADINAYMRARRVEAIRQYTLGVNWRSDPRLLNALNSFFAANPDPFLSPDIDYLPVRPQPSASDRLRPHDQPALQFLLLNPDGVEPAMATEGKPVAKGDAGPLVARGTAFEIGTLLASATTLQRDAPTPRRVRPADIAVLCRTNNEVRRVQQQLRRLGIPAVSQSDDTVFTTDTAAAVERLVHAMLLPRDTAAINAALATDILGVDAQGLDRIHADEAAWDVWGSRFAEVHELWARYGFITAFQSLLRACGVLERILATPTGERDATDLFHLAELLHKAEAAERLRPHALLRWLRRMRADEHARRSMLGEDAHIRLESDADAVKLVTIHKSKGLEYPIVFCPFLWYARALRADDKNAPQCHDENSGDLVVAIGDEDTREPVLNKMQAEQQAEELRLLYVALTRAVHRCYVVWGPIRSAADSALGHFLGDPGPATPPRDIAATADSTAGAEPLSPQLVGTIDALVEASAGAIGRRELILRPPPVDVDTTTAAPVLQRAETKRPKLASSTVSSFSSLIATSDPATAAEEGRDRDAADRGPAPVVAAIATPGARVRLHAFPAGRHAGDLIHKILEETDFATVHAEPTAFHGLVREALARRGFDTAWTEDLAEALAEALATPLAHDARSLRLADITNDNRIVEFDFLFPAGRSAEALPARAEAISAAVGQHGSDASVRAWGADLARRRVAPRPGHLKGFVDLVFRHDGRWYLADYKSNHLGAYAGDYVPGRLAAVMAEHDYYLQYHIYTVGLVRYLRRRLPDFDYERHFGGAFYLFVRGMAPGHAAGTGVFFDRPSATLVAALDAALTGAPE